MIQPLEDNVLIKVDPPKEVTRQGILLPESARESTRRGTVIAVGPGKYVDGKHVPLSLSENDRVILARYVDNDSNTIVIDGVDYILISQSYVLAKDNACQKK